MSRCHGATQNARSTMRPCAIFSPRPRSGARQRSSGRCCRLWSSASRCLSSRPSDAGCSRARRPALPQQPGRRRDPTCFIPTPCRRAVASAIGTPRADRLARVVRRADPCHDRRNGQPIASDIGRHRLETLSRCVSDEAQRTSRPPTPAQPKHQIPISRALHTAGSFFGDFRTLAGVRNSSRKRNGSIPVIGSESGRSTARVNRQSSTRSGSSIYRCYAAHCACELRTIVLIMIIQTEYWRRHRVSRRSIPAPSERSTAPPARSSLGQRSFHFRKSSG